MKTLNTIYSNRCDLEFFINSNNINQTIGKELLVQVFCGIVNRDFIKNLQSDIVTLLPNCKIIGSTTDGEIVNGKVTTNQVTISFTIFDYIKCNVDYILYDHTISLEKQSCNLAKKISNQNTKAIITFADGLNTNGDKYLSGFSKFNNEIIVSGGLSADNSMFEKTYLFTNDEVFTNGAVAVSLSGNLNIYTDYSFNWQPIGKELVITKAKDNIVYTINDKSAYETYRYYLGDEVASRLPAVGIEFPLIIKRDNEYIARAIVGISFDGSLIFAGNLQEGDIVQFGCGNSELILNSQKEIIKKYFHKPVESIFIYSCMARRRFMPDLIEKEIEPFSKYANVTGFFTYGEFYTNNNLKKELLNQTMTLLLLSEYDTITNKDIKSDILKDNTNTLSFKAMSHLINVTTNELNDINKDLNSSLIREKESKDKIETMLISQHKMALMGDMIGNIAHQWRQPLNTISAAITSLQIQKELDVLTGEYLENATDQVVKNVKFLSETITVFRNFLKDDKILKEYDLKYILKYAIDISIASLNDHQIVLEQHISDEKMMVYAVAGELTQVIINIITNAKDAIIENNSKNGKIKVSLESNNSIARIIIEDNGGGISSSITKNIFKPYFTTKDENKGTGIGLYMSYDIIVNHMKGKLYTKNSDNGSIFYIELSLPEV
ncbi:MAG: FIST N-terminal domain-containing protein [Campylobacterota bacterium]|nr:FIST N-terminal domain-containing protein [Campylobacterota bacterium]